MRGRISDILEEWFLREPVLFQVLCAHSIEENASMPCPVRSGLRRVEYNPVLVGEMSDRALEQALRTEAIRILLKHPYQRRPDACSQQAVAVGSNLTIGDNYTMENIPIERPKDYDLPAGQPYEWYSRRIQALLPQDGGEGDRQEGGSPSPSGAQGNVGDDDRRQALRSSAEKDTALSELWSEDELMLTLIDGIIESAKDWGTLAGSFAEMLKASTRSRIDWRNVLSGFRASILSSKRKLTRMRPNRRTGFDNMGSIRRFDTRLLVAVDVSGSISSQDLSYFYGVINGAFRYGFTAVDVLQFDVGVRVVHTLKKVMHEVAVVGRGGTSFQEPVDYAYRSGYDGLVILTDGCAPEPVIPDGMRCRIAWVCDSQASYERAHHWMEKSGRVCTMELR